MTDVDREGVADLSNELAFFENSPVVEVAVGIEFLQLPGLGAVRLVGLHGLWSDRFPKIQEQPALPPTSSMDVPSGFHFQIGSMLPTLRVWMLNDAEDELLQVQNDRLLLNWRKGLGSTLPYPRYHHLRDVYQKVFAEFQAQIQNSDVGTFQPHTAVVTYVNRFALGAGESLKDVFKPLNPSWDAFPGVATEVRQVIPLWIGDPETPAGQVATVASTDPSDKTYGYLEVVTRINLGVGVDPIDALDIAHEAGVTSFERLTTPKMHERWGKA